MDETLAVKSLAALAQETRLRIFRALVAHGPQGLTPGQLSESLGVASTAILSTSSPAGVGTTSRCERSNTFMPSCFSRVAMFRLSVGWLMFMAAAACPK